VKKPKNYQLAKRMRIAARRQVFLRPCPTDFVEIYLQIGWDGIEDHYRAHKLTIKRWVQECGGDELKARRREAVRQMRLDRMTVKPPVIAPAVDGIDVDPQTVTAAAQHLRRPLGGSWTVSPTGEGDWRVGTMRKSPSDLVAMAVRNGFELAAVTSLVLSG
jgi:hypothetical protein